ncbi:MalY/PatB family protein [Paenibacillus sp. OV219]|uniref:MalY/PatB family protein n=1 Tax=Paenibacillus sp. OV219 TaxID=1884377 RepID=UPI0008B95F47|nr:MalY/PatB family protein [Paenibacillus sp. OV219]SEO89460.1 cystathione beta-lyase [Paenibacillus sp. OV219]
MNYNFDLPIDRRNSACLKWDHLENSYGVQDAIPMWVADMDFCSPPAVIEALKCRVEHGVYGYSVRPDSYVQAVVDWLGRRHQWKIEKEWLAHSPGVLSSLSLIIHAFTKPGDKVLVQSPVYHNFYRVIKAQRREVAVNPLKLDNERYMMDFESLESNLDPQVRMMILCNPHNPVGRVWSREELTRLGEICLKHNIMVVSDEIHFDLVHSRHKHIPFASISPELARNSITCIAPSKTFNLMDQHTSSVIIPNTKWRDTYIQAMNDLSMASPDTFGVIAAEAAYRHGEEWLEQMLQYVEHNVQVVTRFLKEHVSEIKAIQSEGTFLIWLDCRGLKLSDQELEHFFVHQAKVALSAGYHFGAEGSGFMRMNVACPRSIVEQALLQIETAFHSMTVGSR